MRIIGDLISAHCQLRKLARCRSEMAEAMQASIAEQVGS